MTSEKTSPHQTEISHASSTTESWDDPPAETPNLFNFSHNPTGPVLWAGGDGWSPLTPVQAGMIFESVLAGRPHLNLEQIAVHMADDFVDTGALRQAWQHAVDRHPALRMVTDSTGDAGLRQRVTKGMQVKLEEVELAPAALEAWLAADRAQGADSFDWLNWRLRLIRLGTRESVLVWTFPHALLDGRSFRTVLDQVFKDYDALVTGTALPDHPAVPSPAEHYLALAGTPAAQAVEFFTRHLEGFEAVIAPETEGADWTAQPGKPVLEARLPASVTQALAARAGAAGATLNNALNAAWGLMLARLSGRGLAIFGITRSGRHLTADSAQMVGCLINTLPLAVRITPDLTLDTLLARVRADQVAMRPWEHCALTDICAGLGLSSHQSLFETMVVYERATLAEWLGSRGAWAGRQIALHEEGALPVTLAAYGEESLLLRLEYAPARLTAEAAQAMLRYLETLLTVMADAPPDAPLSSLTMLDAAEQAQLAELSAPAVAAEPVASLVEALPASSDAVAVIQPDGSKLSYAYLNRKADRLAQSMAARGVGPGSIVALCLHRSACYLAAMLAVWKTGAAFVPLDPAWPDNSLDYMMRDSGARLLLASHAEPWMTAYQVLTLDHEPEAGPFTPAPVVPQQTAYVIYTSGSTGRPKGVVVPVRALAAHSAAAIQWLGLSARDRVLQFTSLSFDVSLEEIVPSLLAGATVCLRPDAAGQDPRALLDYVARHRVTVLNLPTGFWQALIDDMELSGTRLPPSVRLVVAGGERVPPAALRRWRMIEPGIAWINGYGPTEATITSAAFTLPPHALVPEGEVPVGRPLGHARLYVLAPDRTLSPPGAAGELWIGGDCVASGYLGRDDFTEAAFVPDPFAPGGRMYRSGDLARWRSDDLLSLVGRADRQIKLRGYRIEPGQVEKVIEGLEGVGQAVVAVLDRDTSAARLVAWVRSAVPGAILHPQELEQTAAMLLPPQMRPVIVPVSDWPMRPGGKIDMARLPRPGLPPNADAPQEPADETTMQVQEIFRDLLGCDQVGPDQSFFELGGHSLLSVRVMNLIQRRFGKRLKLATLYQAPTPRRIAAELARSDGDEIPDCLLPIQTEGSKPPLFAIHILGPEGSFFRPLATHLGSDQPVLGLTLNLLEPWAPRTLPEIAAIYRANIDRHAPHGAVQLIALSQGSYLALELAQQLLIAGRDVVALYLLDAEGPGGRPQRVAPKNMGHYLSVLRYDFGGAVQRKLERMRAEMRFWVARLHLNISRRNWLAGILSPPSNVLAHQAAIDLTLSAYQPQPYPREIIVVRAKEGNHDTPEGIASGLGWNVIAPAGLRLIETAGNHLSMLQEPHVCELGAHMSAMLNEEASQADHTTHGSA